MGNQENQQSSDPTNASQMSEGKQNCGTAPPSGPKGWHPEERGHRSYERKYRTATIILTLIAAVGAIASTILAFSALTNSQNAAASAQTAALEARRQADASASAFPFVGIEGGDSLRNWILNSEFSPFQVRVRITNHGQVPAIIESISCNIFYGDKIIGDGIASIPQNGMEISDVSGRIIGKDDHPTFSCPNSFVMGVIPIEELSRENKIRLYTERGIFVAVNTVYSDVVNKKIIPLHICFQYWMPSNDFQLRGDDCKRH
jgi:hypothetical protein